MRHKVDSRLHILLLGYMILSWSAVARHAPDAELRPKAGSQATKEETTDIMTAKMAQLTAAMSNLSTSSSSLMMSDVSAPSVRKVYYNGLVSGWRSASHGCVDCNFNDRIRKYSGASTSIYGDVQNWASLILETDTPFAGTSVLDILIKGAGLARVVFQVEDTSQRRYSRSVQFSSPGTLALNGPLAVIGSDVDGWIRMQINLQVLCADATLSTSNVQVTRGNWNRLVFRDISGSGFKLQIADTSIINIGPSFNLASFEAPFVTQHEFPSSQVLTPTLLETGMPAPTEANATPPPGTTAVPIISAANALAQLTKREGQVGGVVNATETNTASSVSSSSAQPELVVTAPTAPSGSQLGEVGTSTKGLIAINTVATADALDATRPVTPAPAPAPASAAAMPTVDTSSNDTSATFTDIGAATSPVIRTEPADNSAEAITTAADSNPTSTPANQVVSTASPSSAVVTTSGNPSVTPTPATASTATQTGTPAQPENTTALLTMTALPVLNLETVDLAAGTNKFIMKLRSGATFGRLHSICSEMANITLPFGFKMPRFRGLCDPVFSERFLNISVSDDSQLPWSFQSFTVSTSADLDSMRTLLGDSVEYFERDLQATHARQSWGLDRIDQVNLPLNGMYSPGDLDGTESHIYVLDTGVRWTHQDFNGRVGEGTSIISNSYWDDHGHGTHVSGIALGTNHGVAKRATLHSVKVLDSRGSGSYSNIISGLGWVKNHVRARGYRQAVVVLSLGGPRAASLNDAVEDLIANGIMVVVAAGNNNGGDSCSYSPASAPNVIAVGASTDTDTMASFSNRGACLFAFAPGASITSTSNAGDYAESVMSGTSMAAPHVAGVVAMVLQMQPGANVADVKAALDRAAPRISFDSSSPARLLNAQSSRLRPVSNPAPAAPVQTTPVPSSPAPTITTPTTSQPSTSFNSIQFPSFTQTSRPAWCTTCAWCMFC